ncbi:Rhodanese-like protein [Pedobacter sp. BAL39]|uniref:MBL fold metallo-hydrolase n=1 Tax=Pedobacter sp. BAL39 TaxID=391596 RepID=UPI0001559417|nr:MBL fold metallo-hydrolase [Pedobacter sp. BAL39]EDM36136.1 Rhodanese-like protein [Pedobacter sp. BAL39]
MIIEQFEDKYLSHYSYAILSNSEKKVILIDPARNPQPYYDFAAKHGATIVGVIETHPHADFVSSHLEIHMTTSAKIYSHTLTGVSYPQTPFDEGAEIVLGELKLKSIHTPGHSPDSICIILEQNGNDKAVFTGDTLFIGDCGRPDLRESVGNLTAKRDELAAQMYYSLREKLMALEDEVLVYPAHGSGSLCGRALSHDNLSTIGRERIMNWALQPMDEAQFVKELNTDQPFVPKYFGFDVELNRIGASEYEDQLDKISVMQQPPELDPEVLIVDTRPEKEFKKGHLPNSVNIMNGMKFETWLGSVVNPGERFYLAASTPEELDELISRSASIGYEAYIQAAFVAIKGPAKILEMPLLQFRYHPDDFTIVDVRNETEVRDNPIFSDVLHIPLAALRERIGEIPLTKPVAIHCAGGYRSAAGSSIVNALVGNQIQVYDFGESILDYRRVAPVENLHNVVIR